MPKMTLCPVCTIRPAIERGNVLAKLCEPCLTLWKADGEPVQARPAPAHHYLSIINPGPLLIARLPLLPKNKYPIPWRRVLKAMTGMMAFYGLKQKDIFAAEGMVPYPDDEWATRQNYVQERTGLEAAFAGDTERYKGFDLWDWQDGSFKLVRQIIVSY